MLTAIMLCIHFLNWSKARQHGLPQHHRMHKLKHPYESTLIYITTHLSNQHYTFFKYCWPGLLQSLPLFQRSDFMMFVTQKHEQDKIDMNLIRSVFARPGITVHVRPNPGYQEGAVLALVEAYKNGWFEGYDWVVRVNPDVLIRNDTYILQSMANNSISGIFDDCLDRPCDGGRNCVHRLIHSDFFAIRPAAITRGKILKANNTNAERMATIAFSSIVKDGSDAWLPGTGPHGGECRVRGTFSPVVHDHSNTALKWCRSLH
jgi:hypothetical protein